MKDFITFSIWLLVVYLICIYIFRIKATLLIIGMVLAWFIALILLTIKLVKDEWKK